SDPKSKGVKGLHGRSVPGDGGLALRGCRRLGRACLSAAACFLVLAPGCKSAAPRDLRPRADAAVARAVEWMSKFPADQLRFDAAIGLTEIQKTADAGI